PDETAGAAEKSGMRAVIARTCYDLKEALAGKSLPKDESKFWETTEQAIERAEKTYEKWNGACAGRIKGSYELRVPYFCTDELCRGIKEAADRHGALIQSHAAMDDFTTQASLVRWGAREVERLNKLAVLGPNVLLIHMTHVTPSEVLMLKEHDVKVAACPSASLHDAYGAFSCGAFPEMAALGITVCLGSDGAPSSNFLDMVRQMYLMAGGPKDAAVDAAAMLPETVVEMATINGAKAALWDNEIGSIEAGKKADITIFDMNKPEWRPVVNPVSNLVYSANGSSADTVIVDGRILMEGRKVKTLDEERILKEIQEASSKIVERAGLTDAVRSRWPIE
ncbi:MAG: amidohydrolase family protein, partial [Candidatus Bathyarchaeia archaeon]